MKISYSHDELINGDIEFNVPQQCAFQDICTADDQWFGGIVYQNYIICGHCGGRVEFEDIKNLNVYSDWVNVSDEIMGDL